MTAFTPMTPAPTPVMPNGLTPSDLAMFDSLRISREILAMAGVHRVTDAKARLLGFNGRGPNDGLVFPYPDSACARLRRDGGTPKYLCKAAVMRSFYYLPGVKVALGKNPQTPLCLVEAEKSVLSLTCWASRTGRDIAFTGMGGCWGFRGQYRLPGSADIHKGVLPDLAVAAGRTIFVLLDANASTNLDVQRARTSLVKTLRKLKAAGIKICDLPPGAWNGPDDFVASNPDAAMSQIFDAARPSAGDELQFSEIALAETFTARYAPDFRYVESTGKWFGWTGKVWAQDELGIVLNLIRGTCREAAQESGIRAIASARCVQAVERLARHDPAHSAVIADFDSDSMLLNCENAICDLRTGELLPHDPAAMMTKMTGCTLAPAGTPAPLWSAFLRKITNENLEFESYLQRIVGYSLTGSTREQCLFFLHGSGRNGKGVFTATMTKVLGSYARTAPASMFLSSSLIQHPCDVASLMGARLVVATETSKGTWDEGRIKELTSGEAVAARFMRQDFFEFQPTFKLAISGNVRPALRTVDTAIRRRMHLVPFACTIPENEVDRDLAQKLETELPAILRWAVDGCLLWQRDGLCPPAVAVEASNDYLSEENATARWVEEFCALDAKSQETVGDLFESWKTWAVARNEYVGSIKNFSQSLERVPGLSRYRTPACRGFRGIRLLRTTCGKWPPAGES